MAKSQVYFAQVETGQIKIGLARSGFPENRVASLQSISPHKIALVGSRKGELQHECWCHAKMWRFRIRGEWFEGMPEVFYFMHQVLSPSFRWPSQKIIWNDRLRIIPAEKSSALGRQTLYS